MIHWPTTVFHSIDPTMTVDRLMTNLLAPELTAQKLFYSALFDFAVEFDSDWFVQLKSRQNGFEIGLIQPNHEIVPEAARGHIQGCYLTLVVSDVDAIYEKAKTEGFEVMTAPADTFYGQRRLLLKDPGGVVVDVSAPVASRPA